MKFQLISDLQNEKANTTNTYTLWTHTKGEPNKTEQNTLYRRERERE